MKINETALGIRRLINVGNRFPVNPFIAAWILLLAGLWHSAPTLADTLAVSSASDDKIYYVFSDRTISPMATINHYPEGVAFGPNSTAVYAANWGSYLINRVSSLGGVSTFATNTIDPYGLAFDSKSNLFVACSQINRVKKISPARVVTDFATVFGAYGLAIDAADNLYVSGQASRLSRISPGGSSSSFGPAIAGLLRGVAVNANGYIYVASTSGIITRISPDGSGSDFATGFSNPVGLAFDNSGDLYVATLSPAIFRIDTNGVVTTFATIPGVAKWITVYPVPKFKPGPLAISLAGESAVLSWAGNFILQSASEAGGPFSDVPAARSPCTNAFGMESRQFFRLRN